MYSVQTKVQAVNNSSQLATSAHETSILSYNGANITFELANGEVMVNLTEMAKAFGKRPNDYLGLPSTAGLIKAITRKFGIDENQVVRIIRGGSNPSTWANRLVALSFAQWLSVDFHLICLEKIEELLTQGVAVVSDDDTAILHAMQVLQRRVDEKQKALERAEQTIIDQAPKVAFAEAMLASKTSCLIGELAKVITQNGYEIGQNRLFTYLRDNGYLGKMGEHHNIPNQKYIEMGLFELKKGTRSGNNGVMHTTTTTKVTPKGQQYFINKFINHNTNPQIA